jgi:hypothetical protein
MKRRQVITEARLREMVQIINDQAKAPTEPYANGVAQIGNYHLSYAYGGVALHRMSNSSGAVYDVFNRGHVPKRELHDLMYSFTPEVHRPNPDRLLKS